MKALKRALSFKKIFDPKANIPATEPEIMAWFSDLTGQLSPENLTCDGELSKAAVNQKLKDIKAQWKELESLLGRRVSEDDVYKYETANPRNQG